MRRFPSLTYAPAVTRQILRDRLVRYLPSQHHTPMHPRSSTALPDELVLRLLLNLTIDCESDIERARATYAAAFPAGSQEPTLEELIATGWFRVVWGRISMPMELARAAHAIPTGTMTAFAALLGKRFEWTFRLTEAARADPDLLAIVKPIERGERLPDNVRCRTPEWVAARLWDRGLKDSATLAESLRKWVDRWGQLGHPSLVPGRVWDEAAADAFREAAIAVIQSELSPASWDEMRASFVREMALAGNQPPSAVDQHIPPVPATLVDRSLWLESHALHRCVVDLLHAYGDFFGVIRLLLGEVEAEDLAPAPHKMAGRLLALATGRPEIVVFLLFAVRQNSVLLADMLLFPDTSALACLLIAQWRSPGGAWEQELRARDDLATKTTAFQDAVSLMGHFLEQRSLDPREAASLFAWFHNEGGPGFIDAMDDSESLLAALRSELARQAPEVRA